MPKKKTGNAGRKIDSYQHDDKDRVNNPPVGLVTPDTDKDTGRKTYSYDPHLDPQLVWSGKAEHTSFDVSTVSLHVHERIDPRTIIESVRKKSGPQQRQHSLFELFEENPPMREAIDSKVGQTLSDTVIFFVVYECLAWVRPRYTRLVSLHKDRPLKESP